MDKLELIDKLRSRADISYEDAKEILEKNDWDVLDAIIALEECGIVKKPSVNVFYSNEYNEDYINHGELVNISENKEEYNGKNQKKTRGFFEVICNAIDTCNNIFFEIRRKDKVILKIPSTVIILLLFFGFWIIIPLAVVGLFNDLEFVLWSNKVNTDKANMILMDISKNVYRIKQKFKKEFKA